MAVRVREVDHPRLIGLGVPLLDLGDRTLDEAALAALFRWVGREPWPVSFVNIDGDADAEGLLKAFERTTSESRAVVKAVSLGHHGVAERSVVGTRAVLVVVRGRTRVRELLRVLRRCRMLDVPVMRVVLLPPDGGVNVATTSLRPAPALV